MRRGATAPQSFEASPKTRSAYWSTIKFKNERYTSSSMNPTKLYEIIQNSTRVFRKGEAIERKQVENVAVTEVFGYDHTSEAPKGDGFDKVDMVFVDVVVDKAIAEHYRTNLAEELRGYPQPERLAGGPSYIELAPNIGMEQEGALRLMALGQTLGLWKVVSGKTMGMDDATTRELAGRGLLMISGYKPQ